ncbi:MAG: TonB-dependent receptor plug domain-containing protein [Gemmatimonadetes bacterium]|nr:TonB-dependent receptor plug domain-containing protein [Gemmatimonadota bacterium]MYE69249.1 TonB-dependent receptor plug domain-containing protein [Gemmatimonadota bacterium]MYJ67863.1 TonB-dependent receptor plug domain-containing protein [Gemmatimonadota bacterium]
MAASLALGACGLETIVVPEEPMEAMPEAVDGNEVAESPQGAVEPGETAEASTAAGDWLTEGSSGTAIIVCRRQPSPLYRADTPLIIIDGVRSEAGFDEIAALDIESFKIVKGSDAVEVYGEAARNGAILIFTKQSDGHGKDGRTPGEPPN